MMVYDHMFLYPERIVIQDPFVNIYIFNHSLEIIIATICKLCVSIFCFISGYGLYNSYLKKTSFSDKLNYTKNKILNLLSVYWVILVIVTLICLINGQSISLLEIVKNFFLIKTTILHTSWYVWFYIISLIVVLIYSKLRKDTCIDFLMVFAPSIFVWILIGDNRFSHYFPILMIGYVTAKYNIFENMYEKLSSPQKKYKITTLFYITIVFAMRIIIGDRIGPIPSNLFIIPVVIFVLNLLVNINLAPVSKLLLFLDEYGIYYWLLHSVFHCGIESLQNIVYFPKISILIVTWAFILMTPFVIVIDYLFNLVKRENKTCLKKRN